MRVTNSAFVLGIFFGLSGFAQMPLAGTAVGVISGTIRGSDGSAVTSGLVSAFGSLDSAKRRIARMSASATALIKPDGSFVFPLLAGSATYRLCVRASAGAWLDPCEWGPGGLKISLSPGRSSASVNLVLDKGAFVTVRVTDPAQLLSANEGKTPGAHLLIGTGTDAIFFRTAALTSQDAGSRNYQLLIPIDRTLNLSVTSTFFQLADAAGKGLPKSANLIPVRASSGQPPPAIVLTVAGVSTR